MKTSDIVKNFLIKILGEFPEDEMSTDFFLDLINHSKEYERTHIREQVLGKENMSTLGYKTTEQLIHEGRKLVNDYFETRYS